MDPNDLLGEANRRVKKRNDRRYKVFIWWALNRCQICGGRIAISLQDGSEVKYCSKYPFAHKIFDSPVNINAALITIIFVLLSILFLKSCEADQPRSVIKRPSAPDESYMIPRD